MQHTGRIRSAYSRYGPPPERIAVCDRVDRLSEMETLDNSGPTAVVVEPDEHLAAAMRANLFPGLVATTGVEEEPLEADGPLDVDNVRYIGRYRVLRELGRGGMGVVFACYDESLNRKVAVKLISTRFPSERDQLRLEREARALARLSHPNVVQIHELGEHHGNLFLAMEFIVGETLRAWLRRSDRGWRETASLLRDAGAGLQAAHAVGLVHRDFKPDNTMVGDDGRVRVLDFGLVRQVPQTSAPAILETPGEAPDPTVSSETFASSLTRAGAVMGTPAYMSPEQLEGRPCTEASDQFSFCVVAYEALFGRRPFAGINVVGLLESVREGVSVVRTDESGVHRQLRAAILRGLAFDPAERWPDLTALLAEFDRVLDAGHRSRRIASWGLGLGGLLVGAVTLGVTSLQGIEPRPCAFDESTLAGTWDDEGRRALRAAFEQRGVSGVEVLDETLTAWGANWLEGQGRVCEATHVLGTQSEAMLDLRTGCFERQRREARAIVKLLTAADGSGVVRGVEFLERLPELSVCEHPRLAETSHPLPADPERREAILAAYEQLKRALALGMAGRLEEADALVQQIEAQAASLDHLPLTLETLALTAERSLWRRRIAEAVPILRQAIRKSEIAGLDEISASFRTRLAVHVVGQWGPSENQATILQEAETAVARIARADDLRATDLSFARVALLRDRGKLEDALAASRDSVAAAREGGALGSVGRAQRQLADMLLDLERFDEAEKTYAEARTSFNAAWGSSSIWSTADIELHLGLLELARGRFDAAEIHFQRASELLTPLVDPHDTDLALLELSQAKLALMRGELERAARHANNVVKNVSDDQRQAEGWEALGLIRFYQGDMPGSLDAYRRSLPYQLSTFGPKHPNVGTLYSNMGESLVALGDHESAGTAFADALAILEPALPPGHSDLAFPYKGRAQSRLALGDLKAAIADLEHALSLHEGNPGEPVERADVEFTLARALAKTGKHDRALALAVVARQRLADLGQSEQAETISSWIRTHD